MSRIYSHWRQKEEIQLDGKWEWRVLCPDLHRPAIPSHISAPESVCESII